MTTELTVAASNPNFAIRFTSEFEIPTTRDLAPIEVGVFCNMKVTLIFRGVEDKNARLKDCADVLRDYQRMVSEMAVKDRTPLHRNISRVASVWIADHEEALKAEAEKLKWRI